MESFSTQKSKQKSEPKADKVLKTENSAHQRNQSIRQIL